MSLAEHQALAQKALDQLETFKATLSLLAASEFACTDFEAYFPDDLQSIEEDLISERDEEGL